MVSNYITFINAYVRTLNSPCAAQIFTLDRVYFSSSLSLSPKGLFGKWKKTAVLSNLL